MRDNHICREHAGLLTQQHDLGTWTRTRIVENVSDQMSVEDKHVASAESIRTTLIFLAVENPTIH